MQIVRSLIPSLAILSWLAPSLALADLTPPKITSTLDVPKQWKVNPKGDRNGFLDGSEYPPISITDKDRKELKTLEKEYVKAARDNYPLILKALHLENSPHAKPVKIVVTYAYNGVAATTGAGFGGEATGAQIEVSAKYALAHPDDLGMIVHEMVHVVQSYPGYDPVWLVEGIADYVRWFKYEPESKRPHPNPAKASARDSYRTTGAFLQWASDKYDPDLVPQLSAALKANTYKEELFLQFTGKSLDDLNTEWLASLAQH